MFSKLIFTFKEIQELQFFTFEYEAWEVGSDIFRLQWPPMSDCTS